MRIAKDKAIELIIDQLKLGLAKVEILAINSNKWQIPQRTFETYWKIAQERHKEYSYVIQKQKEALDIESEKTKAKKGILDREQLLKMNSDIVKIAYNRAIKAQGNDNIVGEINGFVTASSALSKMEGYNKPDKVAQTDTEGNDIISQKDIQELHAIVDLLNGKK